MTTFGMKNFEKSKGRKLFDWDKKQYFDRSRWTESEYSYYEKKNV